jgi:hypothetical protein
MFLPAAEVEFGFSGRAHTLVPVRDGIGLAALPLIVSAAMALGAPLALARKVPPPAVLAVAMLCACVGGIYAIDVALDFSEADSRGAGTVHIQEKSRYNDQLYATVKRLHDEQDNQTSRARSVKEEESVAADVLGAPAWYVFLYVMVAASFLFLAGFLWTALPLWAAAPMAAAALTLMYFVSTLISLGGKGYLS